jgi:exodeoxyribonuclease VIII
VKPGIYQISDEEYFAAEALNNSFLKAMLVSPAHAKWQQDHPKEPSKEMRAGSACHCASLEPDQFMRRYAVLPDNAPAKPTPQMLAAKKPSESSQQRIQFWNTFEAQAGDREILTNEQAAEFMHIGQTIRDHPELKRFFEAGKAEQAVFGIDPETGLLCKCKPDYLTVVGRHKVMLELKSTDDARPHLFQRKAMNFGYFQAAAFYPDVMGWAGLGAPDLYLIVAFERDPPYGLKIYEVPEDAQEYGRRQYRAALNLYKHCLDMGEWPAYDTTIEVLELPAWAREVEI